MQFRISTSSPDPIYRQVAAQVKAALARGDLRPGDPLPSVRALAQRLVVNPNTVARAYQELQREGLAASRRGVGTFLTEPGTELSGPDGRRLLAARQRLLAERMDALIVEAAHLGLSADELVATLRERLAEFELPADQKGG
jgi:GntR family transcriptional regulator